jgi:hypothetical protein
MAQVTIYLPDDLERIVQAEARRAGQSLSAYMAGLAARKLAPTRRLRGFSKLFGSWEGDFPGAQEEPPDEPAGL